MSGAEKPNAFQRAIARQARTSQRRVERFEWRGQVVWIKRYHVRERALGKRFHELFSPLLPLSFLRASPAADSEAMALRERRKWDTFHRAGMAVPELVWFDRTTIALSDAGPTVESFLRRPPDEWNDRAHADLVHLVAGELGRVHAAGLCHGRPHPRDMALRDGRIVFFDFEEEPEGAMPLAEAQARDAWLLFLQLVARSPSTRVTDDALRAYQATAPAEVEDRLRRIALILQLPARFCAFLRLDRLGSDLRRFTGATLFLAAALASPDTPLGQGLEAGPANVVTRKSSEARVDEASGGKAGSGERPQP